MQTGKLLKEKEAEFRISAERDNSEYEVYRSHHEIVSNKKLPLYQQGVLKNTLVFEKEEDTEMTDEKFYPKRRI